MPGRPLALHREPYRASIRCLLRTSLGCPPDVILPSGFLINHLVLIYLCNSRNNFYLKMEYLKAIIDKTKGTEEEISKN